MTSFPWKCRTCREVAVTAVVVPYDAAVEHDGRTYPIHLPALEVLRCGRCGAVVLDDAADAKIGEAFRAVARLLPPAEIRRRREALGVTQKQLAALLDVSESTVSRWETGSQIQQRAMDKLLRGFFDVPEFRRYVGLVPPGASPPAGPSVGGAEALTTCLPQDA